MEFILKMSAREALDSIEAGLVTPLLELCAGKADKQATQAPTEAPMIGMGAAQATTSPAVAPMPVVPAVPVSQPAPVPVPEVPAVAAAPVPTETHTYTRDELSGAAALLMDQGKQNELRGLLAQFGVNSLIRLPEEQFGAFAAALRGLGAAI